MILHYTRGLNKYLYSRKCTICVFIDNQERKQLEWIDGTDIHKRDDIYISAALDTLSFIMNEHKYYLASIQ